MALTRENIQDYKGVYDIFKTDSNAVLNHPQKDQLLQLVQEYEGYLTKTEQVRQDSIVQSQLNLDQVMGIQRDTIPDANTLMDFGTFNYNPYTGEKFDIDTGDFISKASTEEARWLLKTKEEAGGIEQDTEGIIPKLMGDPDLVRSEPETEVTTNDVLDKQKQTALTPPGQKLSKIPMNLDYRQAMPGYKQSKFDYDVEGEKIPVKTMDGKIVGWMDKPPEASIRRSPNFIWRPDLARQRFISGLIGESAKDIYAKEPESLSFPEKLTYGGIGLTGTLISFFPVSQSVNALKVGARVLKNSPKLIPWLRSGTTFLAHGQVQSTSTILEERLKFAGKDFMTGLVFHGAGGLGKEYFKGIKGRVASYPVMFSVGYGMSKMGGNPSDEDAIVNGVLLVALHGFGDIKNKRNILVDRLKKEGIENPEKFVDSALKEAEQFKKDNPGAYSDFNNKLKTAVEIAMEKAERGEFDTPTEKPIQVAKELKETPEKPAKRKDIEQLKSERQRLGSEFDNLLTKQKRAAKNFKETGDRKYQEEADLLNDQIRDQWNKIQELETLGLDEVKIPERKTDVKTKEQLIEEFDAKSKADEGAFKKYLEEKAGLNKQLKGLQEEIPEYEQWLKDRDMMNVLGDRRSREGVVVPSEKGEGKPPPPKEPPKKEKPVEPIEPKPKETEKPEKSITDLNVNESVEQGLYKLSKEEYVKRSKDFIDDIGDVPKENQNWAKQQNEKIVSDHFFNIVKKAINDGKIDSHPDYPKLQSKTPVEGTPEIRNDIKYTTLTLPEGKIVIGEFKGTGKKGDSFIDEIKVNDSQRRKGVGSILLKTALEKFPNVSGQASNDISVRMNYKLGMRAFDTAGKELSLKETLQVRKNMTSVNMKLPSAVKSKPKPEPPKEVKTEPKKEGIDLKEGEAEGVTLHPPMSLNRTKILDVVKKVISTNSRNLGKVLKEKFGLSFADATQPQFITGEGKKANQQITPNFFKYGKVKDAQGREVDGWITQQKEMFSFIEGKEPTIRETKNEIILTFTDKNRVPIDKSVQDKMAETGMPPVKTVKPKLTLKFTKLESEKPRKADELTTIGARSYDFIVKMHKELHKKGVDPEYVDNPVWTRKGDKLVWEGENRRYEVGIKSDELASSLKEGAEVRLSEDFLSKELSKENIAGIIGLVYKTGVTKKQLTKEGISNDNINKIEQRADRTSTKEINSIADKVKANETKETRIEEPTTPSKDTGEKVRTVGEEKPTEKPPQDLEKRQIFFSENIAEVQRGRAETAMEQLQMKAGGGQLSYVVEPLGDIIHRIYGNRGKLRRHAWSATKEKIDKVLSSLKSGYRFGKEVNENSIVNAKNKKISIEEYQKQVDSKMKEYIDAHKELPVYNEVQKLVQDAVIAFGNKNYNKTIKNLETLKKYMGKGFESWEKRIYEVEGSKKPSVEKPPSQKTIKPEEAKGKQGSAAKNIARTMAKLEKNKNAIENKEGIYANMPEAQRQVQLDIVKELIKNEVQKGKDNGIEFNISLGIPTPKQLKQMGKFWKDVFKNLTGFSEKEISGLRTQMSIMQDKREKGEFDVKEEKVEPPPQEKPLKKKAKEIQDDLKDIKIKDKYAGSVNLEKQKISNELKQVEIDLAKISPKRTKTWIETGEEAKEILSNYESIAKVFKKIKNQEGLTEAETDAVRQVNVNALVRFKQIAEDITARGGTKTEKEIEMITYYEDVFKLTSNAASTAGRVLNIYKKDVSPNRLAKAFAKLGRKLNERELKEFKKLNFENPLEVERFINKLGDPKLRDYVYEYWYNSILSGIPTHLVNVSSNTLWGMFQVPHRALSGSIDAMISGLTGKQRQVFMNEVFPLLAGYKSGFKPGAKRALETVKTGETPIGFDTKWEMELGSIISAYERSPHKTLRKIAPLISAPTRGLRAMDVWANSIAFDGQIKAVIRREGQKRGLKGKELKEFEEKYNNDPTVEMINEAKDFAKYSTFTDDPGNFSAWIMKGRDKVWGGRFIVPFVRTVGNLTKRGVEMTPGVGLIRRKEYFKRQPASEIIAKQIEGSILALYMLHKFDLGEVTGSAPDNESEREAFYRQGKKAWSIRIGDSWVQYRRIEPFNTVLAMSSIAYENLLNAEDDKTTTEIFGNMVESILENLIDSSYMQGVQNIFDRHGRRKGMVERQVASFVPYSSFWRSINRSYEVLTEGEAKYRESRDLTGAFAQVIPGLSKNKPAKLTVWGEEVILEGGVLRQWLPYKWSKETDDPLEKELEKLGIYPGFPGKYVTINKKEVEFPDDFYRDYLMTFGKAAKEKMTKKIESESYQKRKPESKIKILEKLMGKIRSSQLRKAKREYKKKYMK